ncbi:MAG: FMN-binding glutamate synthase family protein [Aeromicrobium sp.]
MIRWLAVVGVLGTGAGAAVLGVALSWWWWLLAVPLLAIGVLGLRDLAQREHSILRNYPVIGHARYAMESVRPELQQYFIELNTTGTPFDRETRGLVYARAKGEEDARPFGTEREVNAIGYEFVTHSMKAKIAAGAIPSVTVGSGQCAQPYEMSLLNVSAMSFGSLSANAIEALNAGAAMGGFLHDTGEGAISPYHLKHGGDLNWEIASGYFGCRTSGGQFDADQFEQKARGETVKTISIKLSQGAKPGLGGVLPGAKVSEEIAHTRGVEIGKTVVSPPAHPAFNTPRELIRFIEQLRALSGGKPVGIKLCVGSRHEFLAICKAMVEQESYPDFIIVDGSEGGTGAGPVEFEDHMGMPLTEGLIFVHNALTGVGLRGQVKIGVSGKIATGVDIVKRICQGADFTLSARAMMFAIGCIQAQACHTNRCPVGVATQDPKRARALDVGIKSERVRNFQTQTVASAHQIVTSMGLESFTELHPGLLYRRQDHQITETYADLHEWLSPRQLLDDPPETWISDWELADPDTFGHRVSNRPPGFHPEVFER